MVEIPASMSARRALACVGLIVAGTRCNLAFPLDGLSEGDGQASTASGSGGGKGSTTGAGTSAASGSTNTGVGTTTTSATTDASSSGVDSASSASGVTTSASSASSSSSGTGGGDPLPTAELVLHLDATGLPVGSPLSSWSDLSGMGNDATQSSQGFQPLVVDLGGLPAVSFDGFDDQLALPAGFGDFTQGYTSFLVVRQPSPGGCQQLLQLTNGNEIDDIGVWTGQGLGFEIANEFVQGVALVPSGLSYVFVVRQDPLGNMIIWQNNAVVASTTFLLPQPIVRTLNFVGSGLYNGCTPLSGTLQEVAVWKRALSDAERLAVLGHLTAKWAVP